MHDYEKQLPNGLWVAKRGSCYFLYPSLDHIKRDDEEVSHNVVHLYKGEQVFNRCYAGCWFTYSRRLAEVKAYANDIS